MIHILKLSNGDTIVGDLVSEDDECLTLNNPLELQLVNNPMTGSGLMSMYWLPIESDTFHVDIRQQHVIVLSKAPEEIQSFYTNSVSNFLRRQQNTHPTLEDVVGLNGPHRHRKDLTVDEQIELTKKKMMARLVLQANTNIMH
jgi:hypothetical protein